MLDLTIQIVNFKTKKYLLKCIEDVIYDSENSNIAYEINVLENNSGDDLTDLTEIFKNCKINVFYSVKNLGFGGGHNLLSKKSNTKFILLLNPDVEIIEKNSIQRLIHEAGRLNAAVVGPKLVNRKGEVQVWDHGELYGFRAWIANRAGSAYWKDRQRELEVAWVSGAVFLIKDDVYKRIGGFDENFFLYKEEEDLCISIRKNGEKIFYCPQIKFLHINSVVAKKEIHMPASAKYYNEKHFKHSFLRPILNFINDILWKIEN